MSKAHRDLAARFRTSVRQKQEREQATQDRLSRETDEALQARDELLHTLEDFAEEARFFEISRTGERLQLRYEGQTLRFEPDRATPCVLVRCQGLREECRLDYHAGRRTWLITFSAAGRRTSFELFPQGLEVLISRCFAIRPASPAATAQHQAAGASTDRRGPRFFR